MRRFTSVICGVLFHLGVLTKIVYSETTIQISTVDLLSTDDIDTINIQRQIDDLADLNGPFVADSFALSNILGYPIGKAYLGHLPHFKIGLSVGAGCTNMKYFNEEDPAHDNGSFPVITPNPTLTIGIGIAKRLDLLGKLFYISMPLSNPGFDYDMATLSDFKIYSVGAKIRYNFLKKSRLLPLLLSFGGLTFSLGGDFMYGNIGVTGEYEYDFESISLDLPAPVGSQNMDIQFVGEYDTEIDWSIFSITAQLIAYLDFFYIFSIYSGFGLSGNIGTFTIDFDGSGTLLTNNSDYYDIQQLINPGGTPTRQIGSLYFATENEYRPYPVIPTYIIGLEISILLIKLNLETMVNMHNRSDVNVLIGAGMQI